MLLLHVKMGMNGFPLCGQRYDQSVVLTIKGTPVWLASLKRILGCPSLWWAYIDKSFWVSGVRLIENPRETITAAQFYDGSRTLLQSDFFPSWTLTNKLIDAGKRVEVSVDDTV